MKEKNKLVRIGGTLTAGLLAVTLTAVSAAHAENGQRSRPAKSNEKDRQKEVESGDKASRNDGLENENEQENEDEAAYSVALVGDYNYGCDLTVKTLPSPFVQAATVPKCSGPLADDLPAATGIQIAGRVKSNSMIADINAANVAFTIHDGDTKSGSTECRDTIEDATLAQFNGLAWNANMNPGYNNPIVYTPGDNEWTDCHRYLNAKTVGATPPLARDIAAEKAKPLAKLAAIRAKFFATAKSQGKTTMPITSQSAAFPENTRWQRGPIVYVTINQPGSNNNFCSAAQTTDICNQNGEADARNAANMEWIKAGFRFAEDRDAKAIIVTAQGNPNFERNAANDLPTYDMNGYVDFLNTMREQSKRFDGQVVYVHGDSHTFTFDHPLFDNGTPLANFTRVETAGKEDTHWVKLTINPKGPALLTFEPQIVKANLGNNPNMLPWNVKTVPTKLELPTFHD